MKDDQIECLTSFNRPECAFSFHFQDEYDKTLRRFENGSCQDSPPAMTLVLDCCWELLYEDDAAAAAAAAAKAAAGTPAAP
jgi:hypothetical protein